MAVIRLIKEQIVYYPQQAVTQRMLKAQKIAISRATRRKIYY